MAWNKSGAERVKSYRVYQELEEQHNNALEEIDSLRKAIEVKDELIRRLAAEVANTSRQVAAAVEVSQTRHPSGIKPVVRPGAYSSVIDGTAEHDDVPEESQPIDGLTHIKTPVSKTRLSKN